MNILKMTDSYKVTHKNAYHKNIETIYSYLESRGGVFEKTVFFGLQYYLDKFLKGVQVTKEKIDEAEKFWEAHFGRKDCFNREGWEHILNNHGGVLPIKIKAVKEGTLVPVSNVLMTIENTDPKCFWLTNYVETLLMKVWYPITVATQSYYIKQNILKALEKSGNPELVSFKAHDFGYRGVACEEMARIGAAAHLLSFMGTDTVAGIDFLQENYGAGMCGFSIPATEHSIMCSFGRENEIEACENFLDAYPDGLIACVSDTYDIYNACANIWGGVLKEKVLARNGTLVIRPDSGDYFEVIPKVLEILWDKFGGTVNAKGYKVINDKVRVIQGDGMNFNSIIELYNHIISLGWSADNLAVGSGGGLLQQVNRDTCKFAIKASAAVKNGKWIEIYKEPITDPGKKSKTGTLRLLKDTLGQYYTDKIDFVKWRFNYEDEMDTVFEDGRVLRTQTLDEIKAILN